MLNTTRLENDRQHLEAWQNLRHVLAGYSDDDDSVSAFSEDPLSEDGYDKPALDAADEQVTEDDLFPPEEGCISALHDGFGTDGLSEIETDKTVANAPLFSGLHSLPSENADPYMALLALDAASDTDISDTDIPLLDCELPQTDLQQEPLPSEEESFYEGFYTNLYFPDPTPAVVGEEPSDDEEDRESLLDRAKRLFPTTAAQVAPRTKRPRTVAVVGEFQKRPNYQSALVCSGVVSLRTALRMGDTRQAWREAIASSLHTAPERNELGFGSSNLPSKVHAGKIRELQEAIALCLIRSSVPDTEKNFELCLPVEGHDLLANHTQWVFPSAQQRTLYAKEGSTRLVCFLNLGEAGVGIEYLAGTHRMSAEEAQEAASAHIERCSRTEEAQDGCGAQGSHTLVVEPGWLVVFDAMLVHRMLQSKEGSFLFPVSFRSTLSKQPHCGRRALEEVLEKQSLLRMEAEGSSVGSSYYRNAVAASPCLSDLGPDRMHAPYDKVEKALRTPQRRWKRLRDFFGRPHEARFPSLADMAAFKQSIVCCPHGGRVVRPCNETRQLRWVDEEGAVFVGEKWI